ncbi:MAG: cysteine desulfurase-like protein [Acidobacteriota bacterium]
MLDVEFVRRQFPALKQGWVLMDNAGGSVAPRQVIDRVTAYMRRYQVQLGASYGLSVEAAAEVTAGRRAMAQWVGADAGEIVLGPSTTINLQLLAEALRPTLAPGDELIVTNLDHEANVGPWWRLAEALDLTVREWRIRADAELDLADLDALLNERTRLVCCTHCSNIAGRIVDIDAVTRRAHAAGARVCVDGVAFAPHRQVDVRTLGVDIYAVSLYKTFGPHLGLLYVRRDLFETLASCNHFFVDPAKLALKLEPGNVSYELAAALPGILDYFAALEGHHFPDALALDKGEGQVGLDRVFALIAEHEEHLANRLLGYLASKPGVRVIGPASGEQQIRVPTVSFVVEGRQSSEIPPYLDPRRIAVRWGHFYAYRPIRDLGLLARDGVVRVSLAHYNTTQEVDRLIEALDTVL